MYTIRVTKETHSILALIIAKMRLFIVLLLKFLIVSVSSEDEIGSGKSENDERGIINILLLLSYEIKDSNEQPWYTDGPMIQPLAELAVEQINKREDLLSGYSVRLTVANGACNLVQHTFVNFVRSFFHGGVRFAGIVGPTCSDSVGFVSAVTGEQDISLLNFHIASSPRFTDRDRYGYSFGTAGSIHSTIGLILNLMKERNWQNVAVLYEETKVAFLTAYDHLIQELPRVYPQGKVALSAPISNFGIPLSSIINQHLRVVIVLSASDLAHKMLCLIKRRYSQLTFPVYQLVFVEVRYSYFHYPADFVLNHQRYQCSVEEITQVMEGFMMIHQKLNTSNNFTQLVSGLTYGEYFQQYDARVNGSTTEWGNPVYDGVWSLALALNNSIPKLSDIGLDLAAYTYGYKEATDIVRDEVVRLKFEGASGHISYSNITGYVLVSVDLNQVVDNTSVIVGYFSEDQQELLIRDGTRFVQSSFELEELVVHPALASLFLLLSFVGIVLLVTTHILTLVYHDLPAIRASSYRLGQLAFVGCYIIVVCFLSFSIEKVALSTSIDTASLCVIQAWTLPLGLTLILGTVTAKTWRLYQIFFLLKKPGRLLQDKFLISFVVVLAAIDVILCSVWTAEFKFTTVQHERVTDNNRIDVKVECNSDNFYAWFAALSLYQGSIMVFALLLALLTRKIRHKSFKTKSVTLIVYFLTITISLGFSLYYILLNTGRDPRVNLEYSVLSLTYLAIIYICILFLFFPPILSLLREKFFHKVPGLRNFSTNVTSKSCHPSSFMQQ